MTVAAARREGRDSLYVAYEAGVRFRLDEVRWSGSQWTTTHLDPDPLPGNAVTAMAAEGRNDGIPRLYLAFNEPGSATRNIWEYSYTSGWSRAPVVTLGEGMSPTLAFPVRGDDVSLLWLDWSWAIHELFFDGTAWRLAVAPRVMEWSTSPTHLGAGPGRGDGQWRLYQPGAFGHLEEVTFRSGAWARTGSMRVLDDSALVAVAVGPGRNDGVDRVYVQQFTAWSSGMLAELTFKR